LRACAHGEALTLSLVAEQDGQVIGHAAFSPVTFSDAVRAGTAWDRSRSRPGTKARE
jgi:predicted N-acetyltransferase YhbS